MDDGEGAGIPQWIREACITLKAVCDPPPPVEEGEADAGPKE